MFKIAALYFLFVQLVYGTAVFKDGRGYGADEPHIINDCLSPGAKPTLLYDQEISIAGSFFRTHEETHRIPEKGFSPKPITCITVTNLDSDNDAGYPKIKAGGVGNTYVTLKLKSQFGKGYDFQVTVYYDNSTTTLV